MKPPGMLLSSETYHIRISSITQDDICACTLLADYQKSTYQQTKSLSSISIDNRRRLNKEAESEPVESSCVVLAYMQSEIMIK